MLSRLSESPCHGLSDLVNPILCHCLVLTAKVLELVWHALRYLDERHRTVGVGQTWDVVRTVRQWIRGLRFTPKSSVFRTEDLGSFVTVYGWSLGWVFSRSNLGNLYHFMNLWMIDYTVYLYNYIIIYIYTYIHIYIYTYRERERECNFMMLPGTHQEKTAVAHTHVWCFNVGAQFSRVPDHPS